MLAFHIEHRHIADFQSKSGLQGVEQCRLAHSRMSCEQCGFAFEKRFQLVEVGALGGRNADASVSGLAVNLEQTLLILLQLVVVQVSFVENQRTRHVIGLGSYQKTVDKTGGSAWKSDSCHQAGLVEVGGNDVRLFRQFGGTAYNAVATLLHSGDEPRAVGCLKLEFHKVAHGNGVGAFYAFDAEIASQTTVDNFAIRGPNFIPFSCCFNDKSLIHSHLVIVKPAETVGQKNLVGGFEHLQRGDAVYLRRNLLHGVHPVIDKVTLAYRLHLVECLIVVDGHLPYQLHFGQV